MHADTHKDTVSGRGGSRLEWEQLPAEIRSGIERLIGSPVAESATQHGGFSPGLASRVILEDGRRVFIKGVGPTPDPKSAEFHRREARIARQMPRSAPVPSLIGDFDQDGWVALIYEDVDGWNPHLPWRNDELDRVLEAINAMFIALTPSPIDLPRVHERFAQTFMGWRTLAAKGHLARGLDEWSFANIDRLAEAESHWAAACDGDTLLHVDLRADNILLTADRVFIVDWPHAALGAAWFDLAFFLPSVAMQGGPEPWKVFGSLPMARDVAAENLIAGVAAISGFFAYHCLLPPVEGLPRLRKFQSLQSQEAIAWLRHLIASPGDG